MPTETVLSGDIGESAQKALEETPQKALGWTQRIVPPGNIVISTLNTVVKLDCFSSYVLINFGFPELPLDGDTILSAPNSFLEYPQGFPGSPIGVTVLCEVDGNGNNCTDNEFELCIVQTARIAAFSNYDNFGGGFLFNADLVFPGPDCGLGYGGPPGPGPATWDALIANGSAHNGEVMVPNGANCSLTNYTGIDIIDGRIIFSPTLSYGCLAVYPTALKACLILCPSLFPGIVAYHNVEPDGLLSAPTSYTVNKPLKNTGNNDDWNQKTGSGVGKDGQNLYPWPVYVSPGPGPSQVSGLPGPGGYGTFYFTNVPCNYATTTGQVIVYWPGYNAGELPKATFDPAHYDVLPIH